MKGREHMTMSIHRKKTHTEIDTFTMNHMHRHPRVKSGIISQIRAETFYTGPNVIKEKEELCDVFMANGYPEEMARNKHKSKRPNRTEEGNGRTDTISLPYIQGLSENVERAVRDLCSLHPETLPDETPNIYRSQQHQGGQVQDSIRPVGSKFEMVRPHYSAKRAHNVLGHAHLPSSPHMLPSRYASSRMIMLSNYFLGRFEADVAES